MRARPAPRRGRLGTAGTAFTTVRPATPLANLNVPRFHALGTVSDIGFLAERLASGMLLAATRPETIPALLLIIAARHHPTVSGYITTVAHTFGPGHTTPSFSNLLAAFNLSPDVRAKSTMLTPTLASTPRPMTQSSATPSSKPQPSRLTFPCMKRR